MAVGDSNFYYYNYILISIFFAVNPLLFHWPASEKRINKAKQINLLLYSRRGQGSLNQVPLHTPLKNLILKLNLNNYYILIIIFFLYKGSIIPTQRIMRNRGKSKEPFKCPAQGARRWL